MKKFIWNSVKLTVSYDNDGYLIFTEKPTISTNSISISPETLTGLSKQWLEHNDYDIKKREPKLKPCPVCEYDAKIEWGLAGCYAKCTHCGIMQIKAYGSERKCIEAWNALPRKDNQ